MKTLYIIRHAKSDWSDPALSDYDRPLNHRGEKDAPMMGKILTALGIRPDLILSSPALRAKTTANTIARETGTAAEAIVRDDTLYLADTEEIVQALRRLPASADTVFLVGHNPGLTEFAEYVSAREIGNIPTCGIVAVRLKQDTWESIGKGSAQFLSFDYPKRHKKHDRKPT